MKKVGLVLAGSVFLFLSMNASAQGITDYFAGQWNLLSEGVPGGDQKMIVSLERKEGKLAGTIKMADQNEIKFSSIEEKEKSVTLYFTSNNGYDVNIYLEKKDDNHITGTVMDMFSVTGERGIKGETETPTATAVAVTSTQGITDFYVGQWNLLAEGVPGGDQKMIVTLERNEGKLDGTMKKGEDPEVKFSSIEEKGTTVTLYFTSSSGYDVSLYLEKKDDNHVTGTVMDMFSISGERVIK